MKIKDIILIAFCCLFSESLLAQTNWEALKDIRLTLMKYGLYQNGKEVSVLTPSVQHNNSDEYLMLKSDGKIIWGNNGNGTQSYNYRISGDYCYFDQSPQAWVRIVSRSGNTIFTVDYLNVYRYFQITTRPTGGDVIDFIFPFYLNGNYGKYDEKPIFPEGHKEYIIRFELQSAQIVMKVMEIDRFNEDRTNLLETHYIDPRESILYIDNEIFRVTVSNKYKGFTFVPQASSITINDKWASDGSSIKGRSFFPPTGLVKAMFDGLNENKNFKHTRFGETDFNGKFERLKARFLQYQWGKILR